MLVLRRRWLPHASDDSDSLGDALWLEENQRKQMEAAITNGILKAFKGS